MSKVWSTVFLNTWIHKVYLGSASFPSRRRDDVAAADLWNDVDDTTTHGRHIIIFRVVDIFNDVALTKHEREKREEKLSTTNPLVSYRSFSATIII